MYVYEEEEEEVDGLTESLYGRDHTITSEFCVKGQWGTQECVPVILSDQIELSFQNFLYYSKFSIKWPATYIGVQLLEYLESLTDTEINRMIAEGRQIRCLFAYAQERLGCSAMTGIVWELQRKVRCFHHSPETFWLHNGSLVHRNFVSFKKWMSPMPPP